MEFQTFDGNTVDIRLPKTDLPIGVLVSGGFDSAVLLHLILLTCKHEAPDAKIIVLNVRRGAGTEEFSEKITNEVCSSARTARLPVVHVDLDPGIHHSLQVLIPIRKLLADGVVGCVFSGDTSNPNVPLNDVVPPMRQSVKNQFINPQWPLPFLHLDKRHIVGLAADHGLSFVSTMSHSCTDCDEGRCGKCFQCQERAWAFKELGLVDGGVL